VHHTTVSTEYFQLATTKKHTDMCYLFLIF